MCTVLSQPLESRIPESGPDRRTLSEQDPKPQGKRSAPPATVGPPVQRLFGDGLPCAAACREARSLSVRDGPSSVVSTTDRESRLRAVPQQTPWLRPAFCPHPPFFCPGRWPFSSVSLQLVFAEFLGPPAKRRNPGGQGQSGDQGRRGRDDSAPRGGWERTECGQDRDPAGRRDAGVGGGTGPWAHSLPGPSSLVRGHGPPPRPLSILRLHRRPPG